MEISTMTQLISQVGFPIFVAIYLLVYGQKQNEKMTNAIASLQTAIEKLCINCNSNDKEGAA